MPAVQTAAPSAWHSRLLLILHSLSIIPQPCFIWGNESYTQSPSHTGGYTYHSSYSSPRFTCWLVFINHSEPQKYVADRPNGRPECPEIHAARVSCRKPDGVMQVADDDSTGKASCEIATQSASIGKCQLHRKCFR